MARTADVISARELRAAARQARDLDAFLDRCNAAGVLQLVGFDLDYLADCFDNAAKREGPA